MPTIDELTIQFSSKGVGTAANNITKLADGVEKLANATRGINTQGLSDLATALGTLKPNVPTDNQITRLKDLATAIGQLVTASTGGNVDGIAQGIATVSSSISNLGGKSVRQVAGMTTALRVAGEEAKKVANNINNATKGTTIKAPKTPEVNIKSNAADVANKFSEVNKEITKSSMEVGKFTQKLLNAKLAVPTDKMKNLQEATENARKKYNDLRDSIEKALRAGNLKEGSTQLENKQKQLDGLRQKYDDLILKQRQLAEEGKSIQLNPNFGKAFSGLKQTVGGVKQAFGGVSSVIKTANGYINTFISKIKSLGTSTKKTQKDATSLTDTVKKLSSELLRVSKMLKLMVTRMALRAVIKEVGNGFKSLALHSREFDATMSNLINGSKKLGYSFSAMVAPLINALAPALQFIINLLTTAINLVNQLFSALTGKSTWNKAKDFTGKWSDSIKDANGAAKELKKTVLGFDELNQLQDNKSGGGGGGNAITDMFEDKPIDPKLQEIAKKIKDIAKTLFDPIKKAWDKLGTYVKNSWKYAMDEVWKLVKQIGKDFLKVWSQRETERIFENILTTIGLIGRAVGNLARQFRLAWTENDTGLHILEHIRNIILIITEHIKNMARATADWAGKLNFSPLLTAVEKWLASLEPVFDAIMGVLEDFYREVALKFAKWVIESGLPALIDVFRKFNEAVDWEGLRSKLAELWKHLEPFMETVGEGLIIFIDRVATAIANFINGEKFEAFLQFIEDWMDSVTPEDVADGIEKLVKAIAALKIAGVVLGVLSTLGTILGTLVTVGKGIAGIVGGISSFAGAISGLGTACIPVVVGIAAILVLFYSFIESYGGVEEAFGKLRDVATEVGDTLKTTAEKAGLISSEFQPCESAIDNLKGAFSDLGKQLGDCKGLWDAFLLLLGTTVETIGNYVIPVLSDLIQLIADLVEGISGMVQGWSGAADVLIGFFTGDKDRVKSGAEDMSEGVKTALTSAKDVATDVGKTAGDAFVAPYRSAWNTIQGEGLLANILGSYDQVGEKQKEAGSLADQLSKNNDNLGVSLGKLGEKQDDLGISLGKLNELHRDTRTTIKTHNDALNEMKKKQDDVKGSLLPLKDAISQSKDATDKLNTAMGENTGVGKTYKDSLDKISEALGDVKGANQEVVEYSPEVERAFEAMQSVMEETSKEAEVTGENIVDGIKEPLSNANFDAESKSMFETMTKALSFVFGIASPAKNMMPIGENIVLGVNEGMSESFDTFTSTMSDFYDNYVKTWFDKDKWSFSGVADGLKSTFEGAKKAIKGVWNDIADNLNGEHEIGSSKIKINLPKFASGGFPEDGLFMANRGELVGSFPNGKTAVANNSQIVEGIQNGVYNAVMSAMSQQSGNSGYISNEIILDGEVVARSITKAQEKMNRRYSPQTV